MDPMGYETTQLILNSIMRVFGVDTVARRHLKNDNFSLKATRTWKNPPESKDHQWLPGATFRTIFGICW